jgi:hypothetical protein
MDLLSATPILLVSGSTGLGPRGGGGGDAGEAGGVGEAGGGGVLTRAWLEDGEAGVLGFSSGVPSEEAKW